MIDLLVPPPRYYDRLVSGGPTRDGPNWNATSTWGHGETSNGMKRYLAEAKLVVHNQSPVFTPGGSHEHIGVRMGRSPKVQ